MENDKEKISLLDKWKNRDKKDSYTNTIEKAPSGIKTPLTHGQKRLWFLQQMHPENPFYNYSETYTFKGKLDVACLIESLKKVYQDHDVLRTIYSIENNKIFQEIDPNAEMIITKHDLSTLNNDMAESKCLKIMEEDATKHFDLTKGPLVRAALIHLNNSKSILQITLHHIVTDKWSMKVFREHLASYYRELSNGMAVTEKRTKVQYSDYAYWLDKKETNEKLLSYWKNKLSGDIPNLNLPTDFKRPMQPSYKGAASFTQIFNKELSSKLIELSKQLKATPYTLMLSVFYTFLHRFSGQTDILIGSPITNRNSKVLEDLIGFFNDTVVLRIKLLPSMTFIDLVLEVKKNTLEAFDNKDIPFDALVKELNVKRSLSTNPFFQAMFLYHSVPENPFFSDNLSLTHTWFDSKVSKFDLTIYISEENGLLSSTFEYASDLFEESTVLRFQEYYKLLLEGIVSNPNENITKLPMLTANEKQFFLNQERSGINDFSKYTGIHKIIEKISVKHPNNIAVTYKDTSITYKQLNERANVVANNLLGHITSHNEIVGLCLDRSVNMIIGMLAILKSGCAYLPIDPEYPKERIRFMLQDAKVVTLVTDQSLASLFQNVNIHQFYIDEVDVYLNSETKKYPDTNESDLAYIIYTSGSTGLPKGVPISHKNILNSTGGRLDFYDENPTAFLLMSSISFDSSKAGIFWTLCTGGNLIIAEKHIEQDIDKIGNLITQQKISHTLMLPSLYKLILEYIDEKKLQSLKAVIVAGEACYPSLCANHFNKLPQVKLYNEYGPTEATVWCIAHHIKKEDIDYGIVPIGRPVAGAKIYLLDNNLELVPFGSIGEIYIGGKGLTKGYMNRPELTDKAFVDNPFNPFEKLYKTGDLGKYTNNKTIEFLGRNDQQIKIRGYRVELNEIEKIIKAYDTTIDEAIVLVEDGTTDFDSENDNQTMSVDDLVSILKKIDVNDLETIMTSIKSLNNDEKEYLLNQLEV
jgi:amino acid adenylation domain-containing protein